MINLHKKYLQAQVLYLIIIVGNTLNYGYSVYRSRSHPSFLSSAPSNTFETASSLRTDRPAKVESLRKFELPLALYYPLNFPQRRGGKNLNLTLVTDTPQTEKEQPRILNDPNWYSNSSVSSQSFKKVPSISPGPSKLQDNTYKHIPSADKDKYSASDNLSFNHAPKTPIIKDIDSFYAVQRGPGKGIVKQDFSQGFNLPAHQQPRISTDVPVAYIVHKNFKNTKFSQTLPPGLYKATSSNYNMPPMREETDANWPCFCVPYYLCKNGRINSGGRSVAAIRRRTRTLEPDDRNITQFPVLIQSKIRNAYVIEQESDPTQCEGKKVCCRVSFVDDVPYEGDGKYYPIATPRPEPYYPYPPRFPNSGEQKMCGIRHAYGIHARQRNLHYPADVSEFGEYPWQIAILRKTEGQKSLYLCGGVLISYQWVATAAHCIKNEQFSPLLVRLGEWDVNRRDELYPFVEIEVDSIIVHPEFNPDTLYNDLALIRMVTPVDPRLPHITPICLPDRETLYEEQRCWVSGWGKDFFGPQGEYQNVLKEVDVPVIMREICTSELKKTHLGPNFDLHPGFLCAGGEPGKDACTGDGGSPLVCKSGQNWYVVGLVSWGIGCGQPGIPGIYVSILYYVDWINSIVGR